MTHLANTISSKNRKTKKVNKKVYSWKIMHLSGFEPETSRVWSERDHHYTTGAHPSMILFDNLN